jgi:hypothetical protein
MPHFEEKKAIIAQRVMERKLQQQHVEEEVPEEEVAAPLDDILDDIVDAEFDYPEEEVEDLDNLDLETLQNVFQGVYSEAYTSYCDGIDFDDNPHAVVGMVEHEDNPEFALSEAWADGWLSAHTDACMANLVLLARDMVESDDPEKVTEIFGSLVEAVEVLGEVLDFDTFAENWEGIIG